MKRILRHSMLGVVLLLVLYLAVSDGMANLLSNGSFEMPVVAVGVTDNVSVGNEPANFGWTVANGSAGIAHLPTSLTIDFSAFAGNNVLILDDRSDVLTQTIPTLPGREYEFRMRYTGDPNSSDHGSMVLKIDNTTTGEISQFIRHGTSTNDPPPDADWREYIQEFTAASTTVTVTFEGGYNTTASTPFMIVDDASVSIPEPVVMTVLASSLLLLIVRPARA